MALALQKSLSRVKKCKTVNRRQKLKKILTDDSGRLLLNISKNDDHFF
jgi:hypothetical protein